MKKNIVLFTKDIKKATEEIVGLDGQVTQQFTESVFLANLPDSVNPKNLKESTTKRPSRLDKISKLALGAWESAQSRSGEAPSETEGLSWDAPGHLPPNFIEGDDHNHAPATRSGEVQESTGTPTSLYMTGSIAVGVVIVSGTGSGLAFTATQQQKVISEVQAGLNFLANAEPKAKITFVYDIHLETVSAAPGSTSGYESAEAPWRNAALKKMGFAASRQGSIDYVNQLRQKRGTNWAYVAYFTKYPLKHFAYAVSEKTTMHYDNNGWGVNNINRVFAHETCHIFGAADEYGSCSCGGSHGYLGIPNNNCKNCAGAQETCLMNGNNLQICSWSRKQIGWDESLYPEVFPPLSQGYYKIQQKSNNRYLDAHGTIAKDFSVVTRPAQNNTTQKWKFTLVGTVNTVKQKSSGRFLDAHESAGKDFNCVTRKAQQNDSQRWIFLPSPIHLGVYTVQQLVNGKYMDAYTTANKDYSVVTRTAQNNSSQRWIVDALGSRTYKFRHHANGRFLDAHTSAAKDYSVVTRAAQSNDSQKWELEPVGGVYTIQQVSNGRFLDAHENVAKDFNAVTRPGQTNNSQRWVVLALGDDTYSIQQLVNGKYLDAYTTAPKDYSAVTRSKQNNNTQKWIIKSA